MPSKVTIDIEGRFIDHISGNTKNAKRSIDDLGNAAQNAQKKVDGIKSKKAKFTVDADDKASPKISKLDKLLSKLKKGKTNVILEALDKASPAISKVLNSLKGFGGKTFRAILAIKDAGAFSTVKKVTSGMESLTKKTWTAVIRIKDLATAPLNKLKNSLFSIKTLIAGIAMAMAAQKFVIQPINLADAYSSASIGFETLLGESQGQQMMNQLDEFAKATPFKSSQVIAQTQRMLAMGWNAENIIKDMETIGDAAAATGKGEMGLQQIVTALAQIQTKGRLSTEELNQLAEAGISAKKYIAEGLGYGSGDEGIAAMTKDLESGAIASGEALQALLSGMKEYEGMMDRTANETVSGLKSQIEDAFEIDVFRKWGQGLQAGAKVGFGAVVELLDEAESGLNELGDMLYEVGSKISTFFADKLNNAIGRISDITDTYEWEQAGIGEKISMLWKGVVTDPLAEWWSNGGQQKTAATAGKIGSWIGKTLYSGIMALLGATDVLEDSGIGLSGGMSVAQSFVKGFVDNFDASAIAAKVVDAIGNIWNALPAWGKLLVGGYVGGKAVSGLGSVIGGIGNVIGGIGGGIGKARGFFGSTGNAMVNGSGLLGKLASAGYMFTGGAAGSALSGGTAALIGGGTIAGGVAGVAAAGKGVYDLYGSYQAYKAGDMTEAKAKGASGGSALGGAAAGAAVGSMILPGIGTAIGAGIGGIAGWIGGNKWASNIREANYESQEMKDAIKDSDMSAEQMAATFEKAVWQNMRDNFGDIELSMAEIERLADQIVWGDDMAAFETFTTSTKAAEESLKSLQAASEETGRWMWKAGLGVTFNDDEIESITASFDEYMAQAQSYLDNKHYEFTAAVSLLVDPESETGKGILDSGNEFFMGLQDQLDELSGQLSDTLKISLSDGVIDIDEEAEISRLQGQIADILNKVSSAEQSAQLDLIKLKFSGTNLDAESFSNLMAQIQTTIDERMAATDEAFVVAVSGLKMQLDAGEIDQGEYDAQLQALTEGYAATVDSVKAEVQNVELDIIDGAYGDILGEDAKAKMSQAISDSLAQGIEPATWTTEQARQFLGIDSLSEEMAGAMTQMLGQVAEQMSSLPIDTSALTSGIDNSIASAINPETITAKVQSAFPASIPVNTNTVISATYDVTNDFTGNASEFNIMSQYEFLTNAGIDPEYKVLDLFSGDSSVFNVKSSYNFSPTVTVTPRYVTNGSYDGPAARGGLFGANIPGFSAGGIVRGGSRLITVAEEGSPEMIIPLSSQRRNRALKLWAQAGHMMDVPGFARGGLTTGNTEGESIRRYEPEDMPSGRSVSVDVGGVTVQINVDAAGGDVAEAIRAQSEEIAETVAGILNEAFRAQFENTPTKGGAA